MTNLDTGSEFTTIEGDVDVRSEDVRVRDLTVVGDLTARGDGFIAQEINVVSSSPDGDLTLTDDVESASISGADVEGTLTAPNQAGITVRNSAAGTVDVGDGDNITLDDVSTRTVTVTDASELRDAAEGGETVQVGSQTTVEVNDDN